MIENTANTEYRVESVYVPYIERYRKESRKDDTYIIVYVLSVLSVRFIRETQNGIFGKNGQKPEIMQKCLKYGNSISSNNLEIGAGASFCQDCAGSAK